MVLFNFGPQTQATCRYFSSLHIFQTQAPNWQPLPQIQSTKIFQVLMLTKMVAAQSAVAGRLLVVDL